MSYSTAVQNILAKVKTRVGAASRAAAYVTHRKLREAGIISSHTDYTPFIIFGHGRTGSTMLVSMLQSHEQCICHSELLHPHSPKWFYEHLNYLYRGKSTRDSGASSFLKNHVFDEKGKCISAVGFKLLYCNLSIGEGSSISSNNELENLIKYIKHIGSKVIHIKRKNKLKRYVSMKLAEKRKKWVAKNKKSIEKNTKIKINTYDMKKSIKNHEKLEEKKISCMEDVRKKSVCYEEIIGEKYPIKEVQLFLNLPATDLHAGTVRTRRRPIKKVIKNYEEVVNALRNTKYEKFLE